MSPKLSTANPTHGIDRVAYLLLEGEDVGDATVDGILEPRLGLVGDGDGRLGSIGHGEVHEDLGEVTSPEHLVDRREVGRSLFMAEVRGEDAAPHALPPQELASPAGRAKPRHRRLCKQCFSWLTEECCSSCTAYEHWDEE